MGSATLPWLSVPAWPLLIVIGLGLLGYVAVRDGTPRAPTAGNAMSAAAQRILDDR